MNLENLDQALQRDAGALQSRNTERVILPISGRPKFIRRLILHRDKWHGRRASLDFLSEVIRLPAVNRQRVAHNS